MKLVYNFCSSVYSLTIINLYVHLLPVTDGGHNNTKILHQILLLKRKMTRKKIKHWGNDENTPTEQENEEKEDEMGKMMMLSMTVFKAKHINTPLFV